MGEPVSVIEKPSSRHGTVRFETNRSFTGMGHEHYRVDQPILTDRPPDVLARMLLDTGQVEAVHIYAQTVAVDLRPGATSDGLKEIVETMYIHYKPGVEVPSPESFAG